MTSFRLAPMYPIICGLTLILLAIPLVLFAVAWVETSILVVPAVLVVTIYSLVWLRFWPTMLVVRQYVLEVIWPLNRIRLCV
ncbi:MAG TPA: hypothetical protein VIW47_02515 [Nitrospiraceae bacterium]|jgi:hypothetical protein